MVEFIIIVALLIFILTNSIGSFIQTRTEHEEQTRLMRSCACYLQDIKYQLRDMIQEESEQEIITDMNKIFERRKLNR